MTTLDRTDLRMLAVLQSEGRITNAELAERVSLSPSACLRRLQRLEADRVITGYAAQVDPQAVGLGLQAFVRVQLTKHESAAITVTIPYGTSSAVRSNRRPNRARCISSAHTNPSMSSTDTEPTVTISVFTSACHQTSEPSTLA